MKIKDRVPNISRVNLAAEKSAQNRIPKTKNRRIIPSKVSNRKAGTLDMFGRDIIVIGASVGGVDALPRLIGSLPADLPASVFVVLHSSPQGPDLLPGILAKTSALPVHRAVDGEKILQGRVYVAPPDYHLMVNAGHVRVVRGPKENFHRPSIDALFRTAAESYGPRVVGVVLTGNLDDGTAGLFEVKGSGGVAIVQDPKDAAAPSMPSSALRNVKADHCLVLGKIGPLLIRLAKTQDIPRSKKGWVAKKRFLIPKDMEKEFGLPTSFVCPECDGPLWETKPGRSLQFRCHEGHAYSPDSLLADQAESLERVLWSSARTFDERANLLRRLGERKYHSETIGKDWGAKAKELEQQSELIRKLLKTYPRG
jgi:two-component system, chemotaxis family, protein-glutamate methylesterase/glutaminase